nr:immunoglobulin heavy chain junction region [Macaca mulatta]
CARDRREAVSAIQMEVRRFDVW